MVTSSRPFVSHTVLPPVPRSNGSSVSQRHFPVQPLLVLLPPLFPFGLRQLSYPCLASSCFSSPFSILFLFSGFLFHLIIYQFLLSFLFNFVLFYFLLMFSFCLPVLQLWGASVSHDVLPRCSTELLHFPILPRKITRGLWILEPWRKDQEVIPKRW